MVSTNAPSSFGAETSFDAPTAFEAEPWPDSFSSTHGDASETHVTEIKSEHSSTVDELNVASANSSSDRSDVTAPASIGPREENASAQQITAPSTEDDAPEPLEQSTLPEATDFSRNSPIPEQAAGINEGVEAADESNVDQIVLD